LNYRFEFVIKDFTLKFEIYVTRHSTATETAAIWRRQNP